MATAWLALRELWVSLRLLVVLGSFVAAGATVALVPASLGDAAGRLALALGAAATIAAAVTAGAMAAELRRGRAGWLVSRAVPRGVILAGWLAAIGTTSLVGLTAAGLLAWVAIASSPSAPGAGPFVLHLAAVACGTLAAVALGFLAGITLPAPLGAAVATVACVGVLAVTIVAPTLGTLLPGAGHQALAALPAAAQPIAPALQAAGVSLAAAATLLALARAALERSDL